MAVNYGKEWEAKFAEQFERQFPNYLLERLYDQVTKYKDVSQNPADYYAFIDRSLIYIECKETKEGTLNFAKFPQLERLMNKVQFDGVQGYVLIWFRKFKKVLLVSAQEANKIKEDGNASIAYSMFEKKSYNINEIPSQTKAVYPLCDWSKLVEVIKNDGQA